VVVSEMRGRVFRPGWITGTVRLLRRLRTFYIRRPRSIRRMGAGSSFDHSWLIEGAQWIEIGENTQFRPHANVAAISNHPETDTETKLTIGDGTYFGPYCFLIALKSVRIGTGVVFSERVLVCDNSHGFDPEAGPIMRQPYVYGGSVEIGDFSFVGYGACILPGAKIGKHSIVGANAVVTKQFSDYTMLAGNPARAVRRYDLTTRKWVSL